MHGLKRLAFGVQRKHIGGRMRIVQGPTRSMMGGKMRWSSYAVHTAVRTTHAENPLARPSLNLVDNIKNLTGSGVSDRLAREYRTYMGQGHRRHHKHRSSMKGRGLHVY